MRIHLPAAASLVALLAACQEPGGNNSVATILVPGEVGTEQIAIQRVLDADERASRDGRSPFDIHASMQQIDLTGTPPAFATAYRAHIDAYREARDLAQEGNRMQSATEQRRADWTDRTDANARRINSTFATVAEIARPYGVRMPAGTHNP